MSWTAVGEPRETGGGHHPIITIETWLLQLCNWMKHRRGSPILLAVDNSAYPSNHSLVPGTLSTREPGHVAVRSMNGKPSDPLPIIDRRSLGNNLLGGQPPRSETGVELDQRTKTIEMGSSS